MTQSLTVFIGAVVCVSDGRVLCQLRDDFPWIICPGMWCCCPGGHLEEGEEPEQAVRRELAEEFEITVAELVPLLVHLEPEGEFRGIYHAYVAQLLTPLEDVKCNEGVKADFLFPEVAVELPQHPVSRLFLKTHMQRVAVGCGVGA